jgi:leucyl aminopeptidase (aminopeptidase T)
MISIARIIVTAAAMCGQARAAPLKRAYLDRSHNVHVVTAIGTDLRLTSAGRRANVLLSPDGETAV